MTDKKQLFEQAAILVERMKTYRERGSLIFSDMNEKRTISTVYSYIYPGVHPSLACDSCILLYLNQITAWFSREYPLYQKTIAELEKPIAEKIPVVQKEPEVKKKEKIRSVFDEPNIIDLSGKKH